MAPLDENIEIRASSRDLSNGDVPPDDSKPASIQDLTQGVQNIKSITRSWSPTSLVVTWIGMLLLAIVLSLDSVTIYSYQPYALSEFHAHSLLSTASILQNIMNATTKPFMAKLADTAGRAEAIVVAITSLTIGFIINATSQNLGTFAAGTIFYAIGQTGTLFLQQVLAADTTTLLNRSFAGGLLYSPYIITAWIGAPIVNALVPSEWRWGYGMWAIAAPTVSLPLVATLWWNQRRVKIAVGKRRIQSMRSIFSQSDFLGLCLFTAGLTLTLLPMTLATRFNHSWSSPAIISMLVIGAVSFIAFGFYELYVPTYPILSLRLAKSRTVAAGCLTEAFFFLSYYLWNPYFYSFLLVVNDMSPQAATNVVTSQAVATVVLGFIFSMFIKYTGTCKWVIVAGTSLKLIGGGLMLRYSNPQASLVQILFGQLITGGGSGMISVVAQTVCQAVVGHQDIANVTTLYEAGRSIGAAVGNAISGAIWTHLLLSKLNKYLPENAKSDAVKIQNSFTEAMSFPIGSPEKNAINRSYTEVMHVLLQVTMVFLALSFLASLFVENLNLKELDKETDQGSGQVFGRFNLRAWIMGLLQRQQSMEARALPASGNIEVAK